MCIVGRMALNERLLALDGVRGLAVLVVVVGHISGRVAPFASNIGVTVFFVLSGYLITSLLIREREKTGRTDLPAFYLRRALRLYPALLLVLALTPMVLAIAQDNRLGDYARRAIISGLYLADFAEAGNDSLGFFTHMWSLAVEEQFYIVWPALLLAMAFFARQFGRSAGFKSLAPYVYLLAGLALGWRVAATFLLSGDRVYFAIDTNAFILLFGCALAFVPKDLVAKAPPWLAYLMVLLIGAGSFLLPHQPGPMREWVVVGAAVAAALLIASATNGNKLLEIGVVRWFGTISYGLYLWHGVLLGIHYGGAEPEGILRIALASTAVAIAWASFFFFERPMQSFLRRRFIREPVAAP